MTNLKKIARKYVADPAASVESIPPPPPEILNISPTLARMIVDQVMGNYPDGEHANG